MFERRGFPCSSRALPAESLVVPCKRCSHGLLRHSPAARSSTRLTAMDVSQKGALSCFVREILDGLISQVTAPEDTVVREEEEEEGDRERGGERVDPTALFLLQSDLSDSLVVSFAYKATRVHVYQPRVARQRHGHFCGHFAFHFARCAHQLTASTSHDRARHALGQIRSRVGQWRRYWQSMRLLCEFVDLHDNWWPWTKEAVLSGCMERTHMTYMLDVLQATSQERVLTLQFGYGMFQDDPSHIKMIDTVIKQFSSCPAPSHLVFVMGVVNHWLALLAYRPGASQRRRSLAELTVAGAYTGESPLQQVLLTQQYLLNQVNTSAGHVKEECISPPDGRSRAGGSHADSGVHLVFFDSQNKHTAVMTDEDIERKIAEWEEKDRCRKGRPYSNWERQNYQQSLRDQRELLPVLARCLSGATSLTTEYIDSRIAVLVGNYRRSVHQPFLSAGEGDLDVYLSLLSEWFQSYNRPQHIRKRIVQLFDEMGMEHLGEKGRHELDFFVSDVLLQLEGCDGGEGAEMMGVAMEIKQLLSTMDHT